MQPVTTFVGSYSWKLAIVKRSQSEYRCSRTLSLSPRFAKGKPDQLPPGAIASPGQSRNKIDEDLRADFRRHYVTCGNQNVDEFLRYSPPVSKMLDDDAPNLSNPWMSDLSASEKHHRQAHRLLYQAQQNESREDDEIIQRLLQQPRITGSVKRRNAFFLGIPHKYLRAHEAFHALPTSLNVQVDCLESLKSLRQDCEPFLASWQALQLRANEVWPLLGFGEANSISLLLPPRCRGHVHALKAWQRLFSPTVRVSKRSFNQRFVHEHVGNVALSYVLAEQTRWHHLARIAPPWCEAVQLLETGCHVSKVGRMPLAAAPVARVARRNEDDFWMWGPIDTILLAKTEHMYSYFSAAECRLKRPEVRSELDLLSWIEAQFSMLCCGENIRFADVVWYATLGGSSVFRIRRDDTFLKAGLEALERFVVQFVEAGYPPHSGFERGSLFSCMAKRIRDRSKTIDRLSYEYARTVETRLLPWRRRMNDWERKRSESPFFLVPKNKATIKR